MIIQVTYDDGNVCVIDADCWFWAVQQLDGVVASMVVLDERQLRARLPFDFVGDCGHVTDEVTCLMEDVVRSGVPVCHECGHPLILDPKE